MFFIDPSMNPFELTASELAQMTKAYQENPNDLNRVLRLCFIHAQTAALDGSRDVSFTLAFQRNSRLDEEKIESILKELRKRLRAQKVKAKVGKASGPSPVLNKLLAEEGLGSAYQDNEYTADVSISW